MTHQQQMDTSFHRETHQLQILLKESLDNVSIRTPTFKDGEHPNAKGADQQAILQQPLKNHVADKQYF
jgi:hypothetical protein